MLAENLLKYCHTSITTQPAPHAKRASGIVNMQREENNIVDRCVNCQYYDRQNKGQGVGQCRRQAPSLSPINAKAYMIEGVWPTVRDDDWCGEWKSGARKTESRLPEFMSTGLAVPASTPRSAALPPASAAGAGVRGND